MPSVTDFRKVARQHLKDARALHKAKRYKGAAYLCGYAVEVALKVRIAKTLRWLTYPDSDGHKAKYRSFIRHDLEALLELSGQESKIRSSASLTSHWSHISKWDPEMRYVLPPPHITRASVKDMIESADELLRVLL
jgi:HEPN domain-containing protein